MRHLENDPKELRNAYEDEQYQEIIASLKKVLLDKKSTVKDTDKGNTRILKIIENHWDT